MKTDRFKSLGGTGSVPNNKKNLQVISSGYQQIPARITYKGDRSLSINKIGFGKKLLSSLASEMLRHNHLIDEFTRAIDSSVVTVSICHGVSNIHIESPTPLTVPELVDDEERYPMNFFWHQVNDGSVDPGLSVDRVSIFSLTFSTDDGIMVDGGDASLILDIDLHSGTVYVADSQLTYDEQIALAEQYKAEILKVDSVKQLQELSGDFFSTGEMESPFNCATHCGTANPVTDTLRIGVNESYTSSIGNDFWYMTDYIPSGITELMFWRDKWCPLSGGTSDLYYVANKWPGLDVIAGFYPPSEYNAKYVISSAYITAICTWNGYTGPYQLSLHSTVAGVEYDNDGTENDIGRCVSMGTWFTSIGDYEFRTFFSYQTTAAGLPVSHYVDMYHALVSDPEDTTGDYGAGVKWSIALDDDSVSAGVPVKVVTPLEDIDLPDVVFTFGSSAGCSEIDCFSVANLTRIVNFGVSANDPYVYCSSDQDTTHMELISKYIPCTTAAMNIDYGSGSDLAEWVIAGGHGWSEGDNVEVYELLNKQVVYDDSFIAWTNAVVDKASRSFFGIVSYIDSAIYSNSSWTPIFPTSYQHWFCDEKEVTLTGAPDKFGSKTGVVIYLFNPEMFYEETVDEDTGIVTLSGFWDIHSERQVQDIINTDRSLFIEEKVNDVLLARKNVIASISGLERYLTNGDYTINYYGETSSSGFIYPITLNRE